VVAVAPGRVNTIGDHTDYNDGFVLPMAIQRDTAVLARPRNDGALRLHASNLKRSLEIAAGQYRRNAQEPWADYIAGVAKELAALGEPLRGADMLVLGDVPIGCGLSSSASLEMAALGAFELLGGFELSGHEAARLGQRVENDFLGLSSGIMDQYIARLAEADHALLIDCHTLERTKVAAAFEDAVFVVIGTGISRGLTASKYNERVAECMQAGRLLGEFQGEQGDSLRLFDEDALEGAKSRLPEVLYRRARHVIHENVRAVEAAEALREGDPERLGSLMTTSHESLRADYEVSCPELDLQCSLAAREAGCYGSRMTGAGFGGCTIHLVRKDSAPVFTENVAAEYQAQTGHQPMTMVSRPAPGAWSRTITP